MKLLLTLLLSMCALPVIAQMPKIEPGVPHDLATWRAAHYSDVRYKLNLTLEKMSPVLKGTIEIRVNVKPGTQASSPATPPSAETPPIILDWREITGHEKDSTISNLVVNGTPAVPTHEGIAPLSEPQYHEASDHIVIFGGVKPGENVIKLDFTSPILTSGSAITRYIDKEDGSEYLYSLFVPSDASTAFPVFDQPDLKARFSLSVKAPEDWKVVSNGTPGIRWGELGNIIDIARAQEFDICGGGGKCPPGFKKAEFSATDDFSETKPISTYVFAFAAGPWQEFDSTGGNPSSSEGAPRPSGTLPTGRVSATAAEALSNHIYVRKSQAAKFQPHAAETFRLMREGVKYLEDY